MKLAVYRLEATTLLRLAGPLIAAQLAQLSLGFVDAVMAGRLGGRDLAAVTLGVSILWPICAAWSAILLAVSPSVAQLFGAGKRERIGYTVRQGLWLAALVSVGAFFSLRYSPIILRYSGTPSELIPVTTGFLRAIAWGAPGLCIFQVLRSYSEGISMTRPVMYTSVAAIAANLAGDYILMYGKLGMPRMGGVGCGVASAIVMWMNALILLAWVLTHKTFRPDGALARFEWLHWPEIRSLAKIGIPMSLGWFLEASLLAIVALELGKFGTAVIAGHQIALNVASLTATIPTGLALAITVRVGRAAGRGDIDSARLAGFTGILLAGAVMVVSALCIFAFPNAIAGIYTSDPAARKMGVTLLLLAAVFQIPDGLQISAAGALRGLKDTRSPMIITFFAYWVIALPLGYVLGIVHGGGGTAIWLAIIAGITIAAILLNARFYLAVKPSAFYLDDISAEANI
jgi:multidrug resistance protein, MATE family